jgi:hypothetical protein
LLENDVDELFADGAVEILAGELALLKGLVLGLPDLLVLVADDDVAIFLETPVVPRLLVWVLGYELGDIGVVDRCHGYRYSNGVLLWPECVG